MLQRAFVICCRVLVLVVADGRLMSPVTSADVSDMQFVRHTVFSL